MTSGMIFGYYAAPKGSVPLPGPHDYTEGTKTIVLRHLERSQTLSSLTDRIQSCGFVHFSKGYVHNVLKWMDKDRLVTVRRKDGDDRWYITKQGVEFLREQGVIR